MLKGKTVSQLHTHTHTHTHTHIYIYIYIYIVLPECSGCILELRKKERGTVINNTILTLSYLKFISITS